ncbi:MAG TPA: methyl-accepting chemotaxis protein [bacterium]|nr:methyl-accepting chemotaxis protein [bacterium]
MLTRRAAVLWTLAAGAAYGAANYISGIFHLPGCSFAELRPQVALPMLMGLLLGPWSGFAAGCLGDMLGYTIGGQGPFFALHWSIGNGVMGLIPALVWRGHERCLKAVGDFSRLLIFLLAAATLPYIATSLIEYARGNYTLTGALFELLLPIVITDTLWAFLIVPWLLQRARRLQVTIAMRTILTVHYLLLLTVVVTWLSQAVMMLQDELPIAVLYELGGIILVVLCAGLGVAAHYARLISDPVMQLTALARRVGDGDYAAAATLADLGARPDELGTLARVFGRMVKAVAAREQTLRQQVQALSIRIDRQQQREELTRITETDYFRSLKQKAGTLRQAQARPSTDQTP